MWGHVAAKREGVRTRRRQQRRRRPPPLPHAFNRRRPCCRARSSPYPQPQWPARFGPTACSLDLRNSQRHSSAPCACSCVARCAMIVAILGGEPAQLLQSPAPRAGAGRASPGFHMQNRVAESRAGCPRTAHHPHPSSRQPNSSKDAGRERAELRGPDGGRPPRADPPGALEQRWQD